jgi:hypothetical protein
VQSQALDSLKQAQAKQKKLYDKTRRKAHTFSPGDFVLKKNNADMVSFALMSLTLNE